jgi:uncharacterized NAD(P)/FAD-binding protein YdhS
MLLVGTGLTAVDVALDLASRGHRQIIAASRHGLLPLAHRPVPSDPAPGRPDGPGLAAVLAWARDAARETGDWRPVVDSLRPVSDTLWRGFSDAERRRLLSHLHRRWEVARHRMAPEIADRVRAMQSSGDLTVLAGGVRSVRTTRRGVTARLADRTVRVGAIVNCTGPAPDIRLSNHHLVRELLDSGVVRPGPQGLGLGLAIRPDGGIPGTDGRLWLVGPLRRGTAWEVTAVPELRVQAAELPVHFRAPAAAGSSR